MYAETQTYPIPLPAFAGFPRPRERHGWSHEPISPCRQSALPPHSLNMFRSAKTGMEDSASSMCPSDVPESPNRVSMILLLSASLLSFQLDGLRKCFSCFRFLRRALQRLERSTACIWARTQSSAALRMCSCVMAFSVRLMQSRIHSPKKGKPTFPVTFT